MSRESNDQYIDGRLVNGFDYNNQAWVIEGKYQDCAHPESMTCDCYGRQHAGEETKPGRLDGSEPFEPGTHSHHPDATATECDLETPSDYPQSYNDRFQELLDF